MCEAKFWRYAFMSFGRSRTISRFSAFDSSAAFEKLKLPVMIVAPSISMTLLCAIACLRRGDGDDPFATHRPRLTYLFSAALPTPSR